MRDIVIATAYLMEGEIHYFYYYEGDVVSHRAFKEDFEEALNKVKAEGYDVDIPLIFVDNPSESVENAIGSVKTITSHYPNAPFSYKLPWLFQGCYL